MHATHECDTHSPPDPEQAEDEPLSIGALRIGADAEAELRTAWWRRGQRSLFGRFEDFRQLIEEVRERLCGSWSVCGVCLRFGGVWWAGCSGHIWHARQQFDMPTSCSRLPYNCCNSQVLSRDIRSVTQRIKVPQRAQQGGPAALSTAGGGGGSGGAPAQQQDGQQSGRQDGQQQEEEEEQQRQEGYWKVVLDGVEISYDVAEGSRDVLLRTARVVPMD